MPRRGLGTPRSGAQGLDRQNALNQGGDTYLVTPILAQKAMEETMSEKRGPQKAAGLVLMMVIDRVLYALLGRRGLLKPMKERKLGESPRHSLPGTYQVTAWGKAEGGETPEQNAAREAREEWGEPPTELINGLMARATKVMEVRNEAKEVTCFAVLISEGELGQIPTQGSFIPTTLNEARAMKAHPADVMKGPDRYRVRTATILESWGDEKEAILAAFNLMTTPAST